MPILKRFGRSALLTCVFTICVYGQGPTISGCPAFPASNIWNTAVDTMPVHPRSSEYITNISTTIGLRLDLVVPVTIVPGTQVKVPIHINYPDESDPGPYPIPANAGVEPGSDRHVIVVDRDNCMLYETYASVLNGDGSWTVDSSAKWDLRSHALRPAGWTSADAAGLPIMAGLLRYDELMSGEIRHALRVTVPRTQRLYVWPARHYASANTSASLPPMGLRLRLKANYDISRFSPQLQVILRALKKYGLMVADNGGAWFIQGDADPRWDSFDWSTLRTIMGTSLEAVDVASLRIHPDSGEAKQAGATVTVTPATADLGPGQSKQFTATVAGSTEGVVWSMTPPVGTLSANGLYTAPAVVATAQNVTITAMLTSGTKSGSAVVRLNPMALPSVAAVAVAPGTVTGGSSVNVTVTLTLPAPAGGAAVSLTGSNAAFPAAVITVPAGQILQTASLPTSAVTAATPVTITGSYNGTSAVSSMLLVNPAAAAPGTAAFVKLDDTTRGSWKGVYGADGYNVIGDSASYPTYVTVTPAGNSNWTWSSGTSDTRALQRGLQAGRIAACWHSSSALTIDLNFTDQATHGVAVYLVDWDGYGGVRTQKVEILNASGGVLDSRTVTAFSGGRHVVWNVSGRVTVRVTNLNPNSNAVVSGIFFGPAVGASAPTGAAAFVKTDSTTAGSWKGVYGADGYYVIGDAASYPAYATMAVTGNKSWTWSTSTSDARALQKASTGRVAACWHQSTFFDIELNFLDQASHQVALYMVDWDIRSRSQRVEILDASDRVLDTRTVSGFTNGQYLVWNVSGRVKIRVVNLPGSLNAVVSGVFFR